MIVYEKIKQRYRMKFFTQIFKRKKKKTIFGLEKIDFKYLFDIQIS